MHSEEYCRCGYVERKESKKENTRQCSWESNGKKCLNVSQSNRSIKGYKSWLCSWHYNCDITNCESDDKVAYLKWYPFTEKENIESYWDRTKGIKSKFHKRNDGAEWDRNDEGLIKGLRLLGPESMLWKMAPKEMREAAKCQKTP